MEFYWDEERQAVVARFRTSTILDEDLIQSIGREMLNATAMAEQSGRMIIDFLGVRLMSSAMIGKLVLLNKKAKMSGVDLKFCNIDPNVLEVFKITRLNKIFRHICEPIRFDSLEPLVSTPFDEPYKLYLEERGLRWNKSRRRIVAIVHSLSRTFTVDDVMSALQRQNSRPTVCRTLFELWDAGLLEQSSRNGQSFYTKRLPS
ncbi:MAG: hypothetical protein CMJ64_06290 [Planctomycetaceae bacterium]|nr:hypothetical protein [Planctomycetaceae bacterium]